jgi:LmbE family N-acetylglucosaminyl deacetylase
MRGRYYNLGMSWSRRSILILGASLPLTKKAAGKAMKIVVTGGHPGDPECGCGGTISRYTQMGHDVTVLYLNRGEGYCGGAGLHRCAAVRTSEAQNACERLRARPVFADQIDGRAMVDEAHYQSFGRILAREEPDVVFTQWPIDRHRDHRAVATLTLDAWMKADGKFALYYYEVAEDTVMFAPTEYVDISGVEAQRRAACYAHTSQQPEKWYPKQVEITRRRGKDKGFAQAEAFCRQEGSRQAVLP